MKHISVSQHTVGGCVSTRFDNPSPTAFLVLKLRSGDRKILQGKITYEEESYFLTLTDGPSQILKMWLSDDNIGLLTTTGDWQVTIPKLSNDDSVTLELWANQKDGLPIAYPGQRIKIPGYRYV